MVNACMAGSRVRGGTSAAAWPRRGAERGTVIRSLDVPVGVEVVAVVVDPGAVDRVEVVGQPDVRQRQPELVVAQLVERLAGDPRLVLVAEPLGGEAGLV